MSWLNLNQSLNSLKGQITNFATEVLSEGAVQESADQPSGAGHASKDLEEKCKGQELEIAALKQLNEELEASLRAERLSRKNGVKEDESSWYWDPAPQKPVDETYKQTIHQLQQEISSLKELKGSSEKTDKNDEIIKLKEENKILTTNLEDLDNQHQQAMERLLSLKKELQKNFELLKQEHEDLKNTNDEYSDLVKALETKNDEKDQEINALKADSDTLHHKYQNLERVHSILREHAEKFQEENQDLHEEVFKLQEQVTKLEHEIEVASKHTELSDAVPREVYEQIIKELNDLKDDKKRLPNQMHADEMNIDDNAKSVIENLKREMADVKHKLSQKETKSSDNAESKHIKKDKLIQLYNKYVNFDLPVDYVGEMPAAGDNAVLYKLENALKTLNSFRKDIDKLEHSLSEKKLNINHLQTQIEDLTSENEYLTTDLQHVEGELSEMKKNNDFLLSEITALKNTSKLEPIIETHEDNLVKLESELADCNKMNKTFESEIKAINKELKEMTSEKTYLQMSLDELKHKYTTMLKELEVCKTQTKALEELESNIPTDRTDEINTYISEIDNLKKRLTTANTTNEKLSIDMHIIENDKVLLTKQLDDLKHDLAEKCKQNVTLVNANTDLENRLFDLQTKIEDLRNDNRDVETKKDELQNRVTELEHQIRNNNAMNALKEAGDRINISEENKKLKDEVERLVDEIKSLKTKQIELEDENTKLQDTSNALKTNETTLEKTLQHLELSNKELAAQKIENELAKNRTLQLEAELATTDANIAKLGNEFEKLSKDLNEKDTIIDSLNQSLSHCNTTISNLNQNAIDIENSVKIKNDEICNLTANIKQLQEKYDNLLSSTNKTSHDYGSLQKRNEDADYKMQQLQEQVNMKEIELNETKTKLDELSHKRDEYIKDLEQKETTISELNKSISELQEKTAANVTVYNDDTFEQFVKENETMHKEVNDLRESLKLKDNEIIQMKDRYEKVEATHKEYYELLEKANKEKAELINLVNLKHNESLQYHGEIQRLNHVLAEQTKEFHLALEEKDKLFQANDGACSNCDKLRMTLNEKEETLLVLNDNSSSVEGLKTELLTASDTLHSLKEKCEHLEKSLAIQLEAVKRLTAENLQLTKRETNSSKELDRLREHLVEMEDSYTQELMASEQKLAECQARLLQVEDRAKQTSTVYTSNSIRANQEVETLRNQIRLLEKQREEAQARLSSAEDARNKSEAALVNLQLVLEQFQMDKERDVESATVRLQNKMADLQKQNGALQDEIHRLNKKLEDSVAGLQAASRLGDQVELKTAQIQDLKEQVSTLQTSVAAAEERYYNAISNQQDRVDKNLVKNLVVNYVQTQGQNSLNRTQVLRILSTVLDFNKQECEKLGLSKTTNASDSSLAQEFVKFLEKESRPTAPLPNLISLGSNKNSTRSSTPVSRKDSGLGPQPNPYDMGHKRNPSTGSNNLLFQNMDAETSSQISIDNSSVHSERAGDRVTVSLASPTLENSGINQTRNNEGAILKHVLKDM